MKLTAKEENQQRIDFSQMVETQFKGQVNVRKRVDLMMDELQTLLPQDNPNPQQIAEAKEIVIAHFIKVE